jgi:hypothetical protein
VTRWERYWIDDDPDQKLVLKTLMLLPEFSGSEGY